MRYKLLNIISVLSLGIESISAQENKEITIDRSSVEALEFSDISEKYSGNSFNYNETVTQSQNYLLRAIRWFFEKLENIFGINIDPGLYKTVEILIYSILIIIAVYIISRLFLNTNSSSFFSKTSKDLAPIAFKEEHIEQINLEELIKDALSKSDYRLAIRYMYLQVLKNLSKKNLIEWHFDKTNIDYQNELNSVNLKQSFKKVSYLYDHIWYGEFSLNEDAFRKAKIEFDQLSKTLESNG